MSAAAVARLAEKLAGELERDVELEDNEIEIPIGHAEALVIEPVGDPEAPEYWTLTAYAWDASGGVTDEKEIGTVTEGYVACVAHAFCTEMDARDAWADEL